MKTVYRLLALVISVHLAAGAMAQSSVLDQMSPNNMIYKNKLDKAEKYYGQLAYSKAIPLYEDLRAMNDSSLRVVMHLSDCYRANNEWGQAEPLYTHILAKEPKNSEYMYYYIQSLLANKKYEKALEWAKKYNKLEPDDGRVDELIAKYDQIEVYELANVATIENYEAVNSAMSDFGAVDINADDLLFTTGSMEPIGIDMTYPWDNKPFLELAIADMQNDTLLGAESFSRKINSRYHDGPAIVNQDQTVMYFTRNMLEKVTGINHLMLWVAHKDGDKWTDLEAMPFNDPKYSVGHPALSPDEKRLYFASDMPGGHGGTDLYYVNINKDGSYGKPVNLGAPINTEGKEMFPFINSEGVLLFASDGHAGLGGLDIYYAMPQADGNYADYENIGAPLNSPRDDFGLFMKPDNMSGYFASNRPGGKGDDDIYKYTLQKPLKSAIKLLATVVDKNTGELLKNARVRIVDESTGETYKELATDEKGEVSTTLAIEKNYRIIAEKEEYAGNETKISTMDGGDVRTKIPLAKADIYLHGLITDRKTGEKLENVKVQITEINTGDEVLSISTPASGSFYHFLEDAEIDERLSYKLVIKREGYIEKTAEFQKTITTPDTIRLHEELDLGMSKMEKGQDLAKLINLNPIYFDLDKHNIRPDAALELDKIVKVMKENPGLIIELGSHTDSRGNDRYNQQLSQRRATSSKQYIVSEGIDANRIIAKGYGESRLTNKCANGVPCSKEEHQLNRRTEFIIVKM